jgi:hypothetical protein
MVKRKGTQTTSCKLLIGVGGWGGDGAVRVEIDILEIPLC